MIWASLGSGRLPSEGDLKLSLEKEEEGGKTAGGRLKVFCLVW
jgi:hypothetical protein